MPRVLAVQAPGRCPFDCDWCRTSDHSKGDNDAFLATVLPRLSKYPEIYITGTGETGLAPAFNELVRAAQKQGVRVSVLCASKASIVPGLTRAEISLNRFTRKSALQAIAEARSLGVPIVISVVDDGETVIDPEVLAAEHGADGVIVRALQAEGASKKTAGTTRIYQRPGSSIGSFPAVAYAELAGHGPAATCIDHFGKEVPMLGSPVQ